MALPGFELLICSSKARRGTSCSTTPFCFIFARGQLRTRSWSTSNGPWPIREERAGGRECLPLNAENRRSQPEMPTQPVQTRAGPAAALPFLHHLPPTPTAAANPIPPLNPQQPPRRERTGTALPSAARRGASEVGTGCRLRGRTAMALPSAARRRATWCRRPHGPRLPPHRLVLPSAGPSSPLSCPRSTRRRCTPGAPAGCLLPELLMPASTHSCCRRHPRPLPRASGSPPRLFRLPLTRHSGSAALRPPTQYQPAPCLSDSELRVSSGEEEETFGSCLLLSGVRYVNVFC